MAISYVNSATGTNTIASVPTHQVGDLFLLFACRESAVGPPDQPAGEGWTMLDSGGTANVKYICSWKIADSTTETTGTFTNAAFTHLQIYRGCKSSDPIGGSTELAYTDATVYYNAVTFEVTDGSSWCVGFAAHANGDTSLQTAPTGMTNRTTQTGGGFEAAGHDTNGGVSGWSTQGVAVGGTSGQYVTLGIEILVETATAVTGTASATLDGVTSSASGTGAASSAAQSFNLSQALASTLAGYTSLGG